MRLLVGAVLLTVTGQKETIEAVSVNISSAGVCLISKHAVPERSVAKILIPYREGRTSSIRSECRWTQDYAAGWYMTGWRFLHLVPG